ncbi:hypothetical protein RFI_16868 [Reticulomyxa filosa]|uniref:Uncharacterized protein n=1 Tax=Reticulomyxa filosa TaxID=46433 RepID=X6N4V8_RETFI|nr:hypothetical protein RFI_16868 [Reticulomyxa filosa]|eukprot:ETO20347.1 hypothetical protein RFI_16868 [Reticulomyxa filosa]
MNENKLFHSLKGIRTPLYSGLSRLQDLSELGFDPVVNAEAEAEDKEQASEKQDKRSDEGEANDERKYNFYGQLIRYRKFARVLFLDMLVIEPQCMSEEVKSYDELRFAKVVVEIMIVKHISIKAFDQSKRELNLGDILWTQVCKAPVNNSNSIIKQDNTLVFHVTSDSVVRVLYKFGRLGFEPWTYERNSEKRRNTLCKHLIKSIVQSFDPKPYLSIPINTNVNTNTNVDITIDTNNVNAKGVTSLERQEISGYLEKLFSSPTYLQSLIPERCVRNSCEYRHHLQSQQSSSLSSSSSSSSSSSIGDEGDDVACLQKSLGDKIKVRVETLQQQFDSKDPFEGDGKWHKKGRARLFQQWLYAHFDKQKMKEHGVLDIAGGNGRLSLLLGMDGIPSTIVDPKTPTFQHKWLQLFASDKANKVLPTHIAEYVDTNSLQTNARLLQCFQRCYLVVGLHPDQATEPLVDLCLLHRKNFATLPCCVFPNLFPHRRFLPHSCSTPKPVITYVDFVQFLHYKSSLIQSDFLNFQGRNKILFAKYDS